MFSAAPLRLSWVHWRRRVSLQQRRGEPPHVVCVPYPAHGHITPMLKVAKLLHARGFHVTFVNTEFNHRRLLHSRGPDALDGVERFRFATIPDGLPPSDANATQDVPALCLVAYRHYHQLVKWGLVPFKDEAQLADGEYLDTVVRGARGTCDGMRLRDFPSFIRTTDCGDIMLNFFIHEAERLSLPDAIMENTFDDLEGPTLDAMRATLPPMYTVGPLLLHARHALPGGGGQLDSLGSNLWKEQDGLLEWLDGRAPRSVVYANYGSITVMTNEQLLEFAWDLAGSGYAFVWNIRPDLVKGDTAVLPPEFLPAVEGRAMLTTWCPQEEVLAHEAVGLFLTHSGWNSTLESISAGVPMLSWLFFAEQQTNCRYKCTEWSVGMEIGGEVQRAELAEKIREVMRGEKGLRRALERRASSSRSEWRGSRSKKHSPPSGNG